MEKIFDIPKDFINHRIENLTDEIAIDLLQEECSELIQACSKVRRIEDKKSYDNMVEEMTHVLIMSAIVFKKYNLSYEDILNEVYRVADKFNVEIQGRI